MNRNKNIVKLNNKHLGVAYHTCVLPYRHQWQKTQPIYCSILQLLFKELHANIWIIHEFFWHSLFVGLWYENLKLLMFISSWGTMILLALPKNLVTSIQVCVSKTSYDYGGIASDRRTWLCLITWNFKFPMK